MGERLARAAHGSRSTQQNALSKKSKGVRRSTGVRLFRASGSSAGGGRSYHTRWEERWNPQWTFHFLPAWVASAWIESAGAGSLYDLRHTGPCQRGFWPMGLASVGELT